MNLSVSETQAGAPGFGEYSTTTASPAADSVPAMLRQIMAEMAEMRADIAQMKAAMIEKRADNPTSLKNTDSGITAFSSSGSVPVPDEETSSSTSETDASTEDGVATPTVSVAETEPLPHVPSDLLEWKRLDKFAREFRRFRGQPFITGTGEPPSESFVQAVFPPLALQEDAWQKPTPEALTVYDLELPTFSGFRDPELHLKLQDLQTELRRHYVNFEDWTSFAIEACDDMRRLLQTRIYKSGFRWHHFVFAIISYNGLVDYYQTQDAAFTQFTKPINTTPEEVVLSLCEKLWYAPLTHKTTAQRAMEFEMHLRRFDRSLGMLVTQFVPGSNWTELIDWAYKIRIAAGNRWQNIRSLKKSMRPDEASKPPTTSVPKVLIAVNDEKYARLAKNLAN
ncbi:hypothetical protein SEPCBS57363_003432 [Sporothrix epigloea]|uniref:Uncharacterized protein n=1 Tax=Sporothrix epigloea TaxID=1892477 RepID=A0ABP0DP59_9PEZI